MTTTFDIPDSRLLTDAEKFKIGFEQLCSLCEVSLIGATRLGLNKFTFADGSVIGVAPLTSKYLDWRI